MKTDIKLWEQQPGETAKAFAAFVAYLGLGETRTLALAAAECGSTARTLEHFSRKWGWQARLAAWHGHLLSIQLTKAEQVAAKRPEEWNQRVAALREAEWETARKGLELARQEMERLLAKRRRGVTLADINRLLEVCSKIGRLATGLATERGELTGADGEPIRGEVAAAIAKVYGQGRGIEVTPGADGAPFPAPPEPAPAQLEAISGASQPGGKEV